MRDREKEVSEREGKVGPSLVWLYQPEGERKKSCWRERGRERQASSVGKSSKLR